MTAPGHWHAGWTSCTSADRGIGPVDKHRSYVVRLPTERAARAYLARRLRQVAVITQNPETRAAVHAAREDIWYRHLTRVTIAGTLYELCPCPGCAPWDTAETPCAPPDARVPAAA